MPLPKPLTVFFCHPTAQTLASNRGAALSNTYNIPEGRSTCTPYTRHLFWGKLCLVPVITALVAGILPQNLGNKTPLAFRTIRWKGRGSGNLAFVPVVSYNQCNRIYIPLSRPDGCSLVTTDPSHEWIFGWSLA